MGSLKTFSASVFTPSNFDYTLFTKGMGCLEQPFAPIFKDESKIQM